MLDALSLRMIPLGILQQPLTFRFLLDTPFGFTYQDLTLDVPGLNTDLETLSRFGDSIYKLVYGSAASASVHCSLATVVFWKATSALIMNVPLPTAGGQVNLPAGTKENSAVVVLHTGHGDNYARRRLYIPGFPRAWSHEGLLNGTGQTKLYNAVATWYMAFKGSALANPYRWLIAYPRVVQSDETNFFGVAFRQPEFFRICNHTGKPPDGPGLDWP
jgi:hypothetical protein